MTGSSFIRWEYLTIPEGERHRLPELGEDGWELVDVGGSAEDPLLSLKRPGPGFRERVTAEQRDRYYAASGLDPRRPEDGSPA